jgi:hypothetical protein
MTTSSSPGDCLSSGEEASLAGSASAGGLSDSTRRFKTGRFLGTSGGSPSSASGSCFCDFGVSVRVEGFEPESGAEGEELVPSA